MYGCPNAHNDLKIITVIEYQYFGMCHFMSAVWCAYLSSS